MKKIDLVNIIPGNECNLACSHCANESGPKYKNTLSTSEISNIVDLLNRYKVEKVIFTGGEPTLYIDTINDIFSKLKYRPEVSITTNGVLVLEEGPQVLDRFLYLDHIQLSYDPYHGVDDIRLIKKIKDYSVKGDIGFNISYCVKEPKDLITVNNLQQSFDVDVIYERITKSGRAKKTGVHFEFQFFEESVLNEICPNKESLTYIQGSGWSHCCSNMVFNKNSLVTTNENFDEFIESPFYKNSINKTIGEISKLSSLDTKFSPDDSLICNACEKAFCGN